jgi:hypothetical protein
MWFQNIKNTLTFVVAVKDHKAYSPFHDLPLWVDKAKGIANMVVEIPRGQNAKLEISRTDVLNPIKQDVKVQLKISSRNVSFKQVRLGWQVEVRAW